MVKNKILEVNTQYLAPQNDYDDVSQIPNSEILFYIYDQLFLETLLNQMEIRGKTISYSSYKNYRKKIGNTSKLTEYKVLKKICVTVLKLWKTLKLKNGNLNLSDQKTSRQYHKIKKYNGLLKVKSPLSIFAMQNLKLYKKIIPKIKKKIAK